MQLIMHNYLLFFCGFVFENDCNDLSEELHFFFKDFKPVFICNLWGIIEQDLASWIKPYSDDSIFKFISRTGNQVR